VVAFGRRLLAGLLLLPPLTPLGILVWYWAKRSESTSAAEERQADAVEDIRDRLDDLDDQGGS
jgi:hypothetical protein